MSGVPVTQPDLDALIKGVYARISYPRDIELGRRNWDDMGGGDPSEERVEWEIAFDDVAAALAAERARADQMVPREQYDRQLGRLADDSRRHLTRARAAEQEAAAQRARADQAEAVVEAVREWRTKLGERYAGPGGITLDLDEAMESAAPTAEQPNGRTD